MKQVWPFWSIWPETPENSFDSISSMFNTSYRIILTSLMSMIIAAVLLYFDTATFLAYVLLVAGFLGIGIGILIGFFKMVKDQESG